jgi:hypothetical protein
VIKRYRHAQLLGFLSLLLLANPFLQGPMLMAVIDVLFALTMVSAVVASAKRRGHVIVGVTLVVLVQGIAWYRQYAGGTTVTVAYSVLVLVFFAFVTWIVLVSVFSVSEDVSSDTICGALSVYLLIGVGFAFLYALLDVLSPGSFAGLRGGPDAGYEQYLGYSFVTLTTLGYGNIVPVNDRSEALASAEAIIGQVYLTVLVARLVALNLTSAKSK